MAAAMRDRIWSARLSVACATVVGMSTSPDQAGDLPPVLLWDLDNMPGQGWQRPSLARVLSLAVQDPAPRIAAARRSTFRREAALSQFGFELISGGTSPSGADRQLCERARTLRRHGHQRFLVISNDGYFARLASVGDVDVITLDLTHLSHRLAAASRSITWLTFDGCAWRRKPCD